MKLAVLSLAVSFALGGAIATPTHAAESRVAVAAAVAESAVSDADADAGAEVWSAYRREVSDAMIDSASPREWALAASVFFESDDAARPGRPTRAELMQRAAERAPDDALVQWLAAIDRLNPSACKASPVPDDNVRALLRIEPGNAAAWALALTVARQRNDDAGIDDALAHMASASSFDEHFGDNLVARMAVYDRFPMPIQFSSMLDEELGVSAMSNGAQQSLASFTTAMAEATASAMPSYSALLKVCKTSAATSENWQRYAACEDAGRLMLSKGTTLVTRGIGFAILRNLGAGVLTPADHAARRNDAWWRENAMTTFMLDAEDAQLPQVIADWRSTHSEIEVAQRALRRNGLPAEAPEGWISDRSMPAVAARADSD